MAVLTMNQPPESINLLRLIGGFTAVFSLAAGLLVLFVIPGACSFVGIIQLFMIGLLFLGGLAAFLLGTFLLKRRR